MLLLRTRNFRGSPHLCFLCARNLQIPVYSLSNFNDQRRSITQNWLRQTAAAADRWCQQAQEIRAGKRQSMLALLEERGYVNSVVGDRDALDRLMIDKRIGAYVGIDPTAPSLHVGHLLPLMTLFWMYINGLHTVSLLGGATARVGDPSGRTTIREDQHSSIRKANMASMHIQLKKLWMNVEQHTKKYNYHWEWAWHRELSNNNAWLNKLEITEVLRLLGSGLRMGTMLGRDTVRTRMKSGDGMSLGEFLYPVLQSWDWWHMYHTKGIQVQIGGSDQFGNILAGIDAIKYINKNHYDPLYRQEEEEFLNTPMGFTVPLLTAGSGEKFGKSAGNAIWLDQDMTSTFDLYQFFLRTSDADVGRYLKLFTFMPINAIENIVREHENQPSKRIAQHKLAYEVLEIIHGKEAAKEAEKQHGLVFQGQPVTKKPADGILQSNEDINPQLNKHAPQITAANTPSHHILLPKSLVYNQAMARILYSAGLVSSRSEGHRLASKQGAYVGSRPGASGTMGDQLEFTPVANWFPKDTEKYVIDDDLLILRVGKWKLKIIKIVSDEEFERQGLTAPGWKEEPEPWEDRAKKGTHGQTKSPQWQAKGELWKSKVKEWQPKKSPRNSIIRTINT